MAVSPYRRSSPIDINPPFTIQKPFPLQGTTAQPAFAPALVIAVGRVSLAALAKYQLYQNSFPCQKVTILNEGGGDLVYGINGVNLNVPTGTPPAASAIVGNAFRLVSGAAKDVWVDDAMYLWVGSVAGTLMSFEISGTSIPPALLGVGP